MSAKRPPNVPRFEVERKFESNHNTIRDRLTDAGFEQTAELSQVDRYLDHPQRHFETTDEALRLRVITAVDGAHPRCELTYKGPRRGSQAKARRELSVELDDPAVAQELLIAVGFDPVASVEKRRICFNRGDETVVLDTVDGLGEYVEVELVHDDIDAAEVALDRLIEELGLDLEREVSATYLELILKDNPR